MQFHNITIKGSMLVTATFAQIEYSLTIAPVCGGRVTVANPSPYYLNDVVALTTVADAG